jgi:hypothetical protein
MLYITTLLLLGIAVSQDSPCFKTGCYSHICSHRDSLDCDDFKPVYTCYQQAQCAYINHACQFNFTNTDNTCIAENINKTKICKSDGCFENNDHCYEFSGFERDYLCAFNPVAPPENICYNYTSCELVNNQCSFVENEKFKTCQKEKGHECRRSGCFNELCTDGSNDDAMDYSSCLFKSEYQCYNNATCGRQANNTCGWTYDKGLNKCINETVTDSLCKVSGCNYELCVDVSTPDIFETNPDIVCEFDGELNCHILAKCKRVEDKCKWVYNDEYAKCVMDFESYLDSINTSHMVVNNRTS